MSCFPDPCAWLFAEQGAGRVGPVLVMAVDGNSLVHRSFHAQARTGHAAWAVRGC